MKKLTVYVRLHSFFYQLIKRTIPLDKIESLDALEILKVDIKQGFKIVLIRVKMKEGYTIKDFKLGKSSEILYVLQNQGDTFVALIRGGPPKYLLKQFKSISEKFDMNVIWDTPTRMANDVVVFSVIGDEEQLNKIMKYMKLIGNIEKISFTKSFLAGHDPLSLLTEKQRVVITAAKQHGYYEYPRKITSEKLAECVGISKATVVEHLRKAEQRILDHILAGY